MADEIVYKKMTRKADKGLEGKVIAKHGKQTNLKTLILLSVQKLLKLNKRCKKGVRFLFESYSFLLCSC